MSCALGACQVAMVIDLTNTSRFYDMQELPPQTLYFKVCL